MQIKSLVSQVELFSTQLIGFELQMPTDSHGFEDVLICFNYDMIFREKKRDFATMTSVVVAHAS